MAWDILITCPPMLATLDMCKERLKAENLEVVAPKIQQQLSEQELCEIIADFDGVIAGDDPFTASVLETGREGRLKVLAKWGIGTDAFDLNAAKRLGIYTSNTPNVFGDEVADVALGYIILLARQLHKIDQAVRNEQWLKIQGTSLKGKVAGIIGLGSIGKALANRLNVLGMKLIGYDVNAIDSGFYSETSLKQVNLEELFAEADCIILCCNLTPENYHLLDNKAFERMKAGVWLVNVARGPLIDEDALMQAIELDKVAGAALDVFEVEPLLKGHPLCAYDQVILGSHNSSNTREAVLKVNQLAIDNLVRDLKRAEAKKNK